MTRGNVNSDTGRIADSSITTAAIPFSEGMVSGFETASHPEVTGYKPKGRFSSFWGQADSASEPDIEVHLYALCWNEEHRLPYRFWRDDVIVDRYFIFDNHSTDDSLRLLTAYLKARGNDSDLDGQSFVESAQKFNNCWK